MRKLVIAAAVIGVVALGIGGGSIAPATHAAPTMAQQFNTWRSGEGGAETRAVVADVAAAERDINGTTASVSTLESDGYSLATDASIAATASPPDPADPAGYHAAMMTFARAGLALEFDHWYAAGTDLAKGFQAMHSVERATS